MPCKSTTIFSIPVELAQRILTFCHPWDVASFSRSSHLAYNLVYHPTDQYLWRQLFLAYPFDNPLKLLEYRRKANLRCPTVLNWKTNLISRLRAQLIASNPSSSESDILSAITLFISIVHSVAPPFESKSSVDDSYDLQWLITVFRTSRILDHSFSSTEVTRLQSQLRSYLALSLDDNRDLKTRNRLKERRNKSRGFVYDLRNYNSENNWGPYFSDGNINWVHVEHLINVVLMNLDELPGAWTNTRPPLGLSATRPYSAPGSYQAHDWAGVEGTWRRYVCFMDYRDLFAFNYSDLADGPRHPRFFEDPRFREATRLIEVKLRLLPTAQRTRFYNQIIDGESPLAELYPPLYFVGSSKGVNGNEAVVEGFVQMAKDGKPRWQFMSIYDNSPQWSSNGVQIGEVGSGMGVVGVWTTTIHDQGDPVGPFWLWKVEDDSPEHVMEYT
ncbi:hypothetical protein BDQ17DRAFT_1269290 [Cyathus striatus]|nr:hypothetical protein BDQ17DRAFT_1269290 [Cyathus striatus]